MRSGGRLVLIFAAAWPALGCFSRPQGSAVEDNLLAFLDRRLAPSDLVITYTDLHELHGGLRMTIYGSGRVEQEAVRAEAESPRQLSQEDVRRLVRLLIELKAWKQEVPGRPALPDESRAYLRIRTGAARSEIWEWYNEMREIDRLIRVIDTMKQLAWKARED